MVLSLSRNVVTAGLRLQQVIRPTLAVASEQRRFLNVHEHCSQELLRKHGVNTARGAVAFTPDEAVEVAKSFTGDVDYVIKAQVLAGGRGLGVFTSGLRGGVHLCSTLDQVRHYASMMLGSKLVTKQTGAEGRLVSRVFVVERLYIRREFYFAILMDRTYNGPVIVASSRGGMDIENVAHETPELIIKEPVDIYKGIQNHQVHDLAVRLGFSPKAVPEAMEQMTRLYNLFMKTDATLLEINPFVETYDGKVVCLDAKINFDDNASFRQEKLFDLRDPDQEDSREQAASAFNLNYIGLDGNIACLGTFFLIFMKSEAIQSSKLIHIETPPNLNFIIVSKNKKRRCCPIRRTLHGKFQSIHHPVC
eukprot:TRINITY_DN2909_c0_g2_i1.p1 TRINITY_DN2909_c0_g2~~TRINITY_DN2909_c0_g2_i1.p1  ORF type:complete len:363 (+),score=79.97 TRINITY_DN2909_c0_g2_i1:55-1143(+)